MSKSQRLQYLLEKYLASRCTASELDELLQLIKKAEHEPEFKHHLNIYWQEMTEIFPQADSLSDRGKEKWFHKIHSDAIGREGSTSDSDTDNLHNRKKKHRMGPYKSRSVQWLKVAAVAVLTVFVYLFNQIVTQSGPVQETVYHEKVSERGEKIRFQLPDGTQVHLNSESSLEYPDFFEGTSREVRLEGEAYFVVAHNEVKPFLVHTGEVTTRVLGTQFNVSSYPGHEQVSIAVATGKVAVSNQNNREEGARQVILEANEWASYSTVRHSFSTGHGDITSFTSWNENILLYHDEKLSEVAAQLERWYGVDIFFDNEKLKHCVIRGEHRNEPLVNVLDAITYAFDMEYQIEGINVKLSGEGCTRISPGTQTENEWNSM